MLLPLMFVFLIFIWALIKFYALARGPIIQSPFSNYFDLDTKKINECIKNNYERTDLDWLRVAEIFCNFPGDFPGTTNAACKACHAQLQ